MADVDPGDIVEVTVLAKFNALQDVQNVYTMRFSDLAGADSADVLDDLITIFQALYTILAPILTVLITFNGIRAVNRTKGTDIGQADFPTLVAGTASGEPLPPQTAYGVTMKTRVLRRVGRKFIGVAAEPANTGAGVPSSTVLGTLATFAAQLLLTQLGGAAREYGFGIVNNLGGAFEPFISVLLTTTWVTQRRRRAGVGS